MALRPKAPELLGALMLNQGPGHGRSQWTTRDMLTNLTGVVAPLCLRSGSCQRLTVLLTATILTSTRL